MQISANCWLTFKRTNRKTRSIRDEHQRGNLTGLQRLQRRNKWFWRSPGLVT